MKQQDQTPEAQAKYSSEHDEWAGLAEGFMFDVGSAYAHFEQVKDKRKAQGLQYPLAAVLTLGVLGKNEDHCGLRLPNLAHVFAILNNWALGLFALSGGGNFSKAQRAFNAQPNRALNLLLRQNPTFE